MLAFPEGSVGAQMDFDLVAVREDVSLDVVLRYLRRRGSLPKGSDRLMVVDRDGLLRGTLQVEALVVHPGETQVTTVMEKGPVFFHTTDDAADDAADAARAFERYDLIVAPVVNAHQQLVGCPKVDNMLDHLRLTSHKDVLAPVGLSEDEDLFAPPWRAARGRWPGWRSTCSPPSSPGGSSASLRTPSRKSSPSPPSCLSSPASAATRGTRPSFS